MSSRRGKGSILSDEDMRLWWRVVEDVRPLPGRQRPDLPRGHEANAGGTTSRRSPETSRNGAPPDLPAAARPRTAAQRALEPGTAHGLDRRTARRFRRGELEIDARYDLHGMTRVKAHGALQAFLAAAQERGCRCVVVVTGKGQKAPLEPQTGVIKATLPRWLNEPQNRQRIIAFAPARPQHGGEGAFYILLKKPR